MLRNLEVSGLQEQTLSNRQTNVRNVIEDELEVLDTFLTGSYRRSTLIAPLKEADVDVFVVLDPQYYDADAPAALLDRVKRALKRRYRTPDVSRNGQAVTIRFEDFKVDVVPGFNRQGGGYLIPDSTRSTWISTDPKTHVSLWSAANKAHYGDLVPLIKILKGWNKSRELMRSFHLETLALRIFDGAFIDQHQDAVREFFEQAKGMMWTKVPDPAGYSDDVATYISSKDTADSIASRLRWAGQQAAEALSLEERGNISGAFDKWRQVFKGYFPTYG